MYVSLLYVLLMLLSSVARLLAPLVSRLQRQTAQLEGFGTTAPLSTTPAAPTPHLPPQQLVGSEPGTDASNQAVSPMLTNLAKLLGVGSLLPHAPM